MAAPMEIENPDKFTISFVNKTFQKDVKTLSGIKDIFNEFKLKQKSLEKQLSLASSEVPNEIEKAINDAEDAGKRIKKLGGKKEKLHHKIQKQNEETSSLLENVQQMTTEVNELEKLSSYLSCAVQIDKLSSTIETQLTSDSFLESVDTFMELTSLYNKLQGSECRNLLHFASESCIFWFKLLRDKLADDFEEVLKQMNWPVIAKTMKTSPTSAGDAKAKMEKIFKLLLKLQLPDSLTKEVQAVHPLLVSIPGFRLPILPIQQMIKPLKRRFKYHFYGSKQTNDIGKPEWYFSQVLNWIRDHADFLDQRIQPLLNGAGQQDVSARLEFMIGMMSFVMEKMVKDLPELMNDEHQFSHLVDEALLFDRVMRSSYGYSGNHPGSLHVLSEERAFDKWIKIERKFALEKIDGMMSSAKAWESQYRHIADVDELKVPECGESFMTLMLTITDRYKPLPLPNHKIQFLDLQLELLEDFRVRLVQVKDTTQNAMSECFCAIMNTAFYVAEVLREWNELVFFLQLQYHRMEASESKQEGVEPACDIAGALQNAQAMMDSDVPFGYTAIFDDTIELYDRLRNDMMKVMVNHVFIDVKARSKPYREDKWISLPYQKDVTLGLSTSACEMLLVLKDYLLEVSELISKPLFNQFWEKMAEKLNHFIFKELIERNKFNQGGASQLHFDMTRNLFPLFGEYTPKPDTYFRDVKEALILLNLNVGSGLLMKSLLNEALHQTTQDEGKLKEAQSALHDVGVFKLSLDQSELILSLRTNLVT